jgi:hypothetical protein
VRLGAEEGRIFDLYIAALTHPGEFDSLRRELGAQDWIIFGGAGSLPGVDQLPAAIHPHRSIASAQGENADGSMLWVSPKDSYIDVIFASPNLHPINTVPEAILSTKDRALPNSLRQLPGARPIAVRLRLDENSSRNPSSGDSGASLSVVPKSPPDDLEQRVRAAIEPILVKLIEDLRGKV